jgi:hypothetical protein
MKLEINLDLEAALASALSPGNLAPILDKHIAEAVTSAVRDATGYNSAFNKALKEQLSAAMPHGLKLDDVAKFQHVLNDSLAQLVGGMNADAINTAMRKVAAQAMPEVPAVVKLSKVLEEARDSFHKEKHEAFYALWEPSTYGGGHLYLDGDEKPGSGFSSREGNKYKAEHHLAVTSEGEVYSLKLNGKQVTPSSRPDVISQFEGLLLAMYVGRTRLEVDLDADDVESAAAEQYD